jgi:parvulin-like peptidyl-prolyl isomerase
VSSPPRDESQSETGIEVDPQHGSRRALALLALGATAGLLAAAVGLLTPADRAGVTPPDGAVAIVNGEVIRRDDYERLLAALASDSRNPIDDAARRHVLDRMIEEELLVQRGLALGLAQVDRRVRADLTQSLIASVVSTAEDREPEPEELEAFYRENGDFFTRPGRLRVWQIFFRVPAPEDEPTARERAERARAALLAGRPFADVRDELGDGEISPLPDTMLPATKLREYVGPTALQAVQALAVGEVSEPVRSGVGMHLLILVDRTENETPPHAQIADQVRTEWRRRAGDRALREYLDSLRESGDVQTWLDVES